MLKYNHMNCTPICSFWSYKCSVIHIFFLPANIGFSCAPNATVPIMPIMPCAVSQSCIMFTVCARCASPGAVTWAPSSKRNSLSLSLGRCKSWQEFVFRKSCLRLGCWQSAPSLHIPSTWFQRRETFCRVRMLNIGYFLISFSPQYRQWYLHINA